MVDLDWIANKLIEREALKRTKRLTRFPMAIQQITIKMEFAGLYADIETTAMSKDELIADIDLLYALGFTKPTRGNWKEQVDMVDQQAIVEAVTLSSKKTNAGKPMYEVVVRVQDGSKHTILKLNKSEFRAGDDVWMYKNEKGYPDIQLDFPEGTEKLPF